MEQIWRKPLKKWLAKQLMLSDLFVEQAKT